mgnify:FL=1
MRARIRLSCRASSMIGQVVVRVISISLGNVVYILRAIRLHQHDVTVQPILVGVARRSGSACVSSIALIGDSRCCKRSQHHAAHHGTDKSETDNKFCLFHLYPSSYCLVIFAKSVLQCAPSN